MLDARKGKYLLANAETEAEFFYKRIDAKPDGSSLIKKKEITADALQKKEKTRLRKINSRNKKFTVDGIENTNQ